MVQLQMHVQTTDMGEANGAARQHVEILACLSAFCFLEPFPHFPPLEIASPEPEFRLWVETKSRNGFVFSRNIELEA